MNQINKTSPVGLPKLAMNRTHRVTNPEHLTTFNGSELIPIFTFPTLPGGTYKIDLGTITRMPALKHPIMGKLWLDCYSFYVPYDLVDQKFDKLISEGHDNTFIEALYGRGSHNPNPQSVGQSITPDLFVPHIEGSIGAKDFSMEPTTPDSERGLSRRLLNYIGVPWQGSGMGRINAGYDENLSAYPIRAYNLIWSCHFRHPFLDNPLVTDFDQPVSYIYDNILEEGKEQKKVHFDDDDNDLVARYKIMRVNRAPDFFSKGFVSAQLNTGIGINLGGELPVTFEGSGEFPVILNDYWAPVGLDDNPNFYSISHYFRNTGTTGIVDRYDKYSTGDNAFEYRHIGTSEPTNSHVITPAGSIGLDTEYPVKARLGGATGIADISSAEAKVDAVVKIGINQLREAIILQHISEKAMYGTDMKTILRSSFALDLPDYKLDEPLFIGGRRVPIQINQVTNTTNTTDAQGDLVVPTGEYAGQSTTIDNLSGVNGDNIFVTAYNYGLIMILVCVRHESVYQYGIDPIFAPHDKFDFYWPEFAGITRIPIKERFIYRSGIEHDDKHTFNFGPYGIEYLNDHNRVSGDFASNYSTPLDDWHLADKYDSAPHFDSSWIKDTTKEVLARALALDSATAPQFMSYFRATFTRDIPVAMVEPGVTRI